MQDKIRESLLQELEKHVQKKNIIKQTGFISSQFYLNSLIYRVELDNLTLKDEKEEIYVCLNLNQVYKVDILNSCIQIYLDNDTQICIKK